MSGYEDFVGVVSNTVPNEVEKGAIRKFADAIGDDDRIYREVEVAKAAGYRGIPIPPTFSRTFDFGVIEGLVLPTNGLIHGEQRFKYNEPICAGDVVYCSRSLLRVRPTSGRMGKMTFFMFEGVVKSGSGEVLLVENSTVIQVGAGE
ncbi:MAG: MaoC family dehydratase N-terminal domain-containing protein [Alicyclobacillaceae bacterium]|nr:MaoC family dehydratase N-terminal domain-containing protein [Alicyclobacillaceae bacterium]